MTKHCADCGEKLILRTNREDGSKFYGCSEYPECDYTQECDEDDPQGWDERDEELNPRR